MPAGSQFILDKKEDGTLVPIRYIGKKIERDAGSLRGVTDKTEHSNQSTTAQYTAGALSNNSILNSSKNVNKGRVVYEDSVDRSRLSDKQKAQIKFIEVVAAVTGVEIHLFESQLDQNGMYDSSYNVKFIRSSNTLRKILKRACRTLGQRS